MIQKIKAEIEQLKKHYLKRQEYDLGWNEALDNLLSFIESLEKEQDGTLATDDPATNEEVEKMLKEKRDKQRYEVLKAVEKEYGSQLNQAWDDALHEGYLNGWKECESAWKRAQDELPKIKGWVARNRPNVSPSLQFFYKKPIREDNGYGDKFWHSPTIWSESISISPKLFPDLKWIDEPIEVELVIHRV